MATRKLPNIGAKQIGQNLNVKIGEGDAIEAITFKGSKEEITPIKELIKSYNEKKTAKTHDAILALLKPKATEEKVTKEKKETEIKAEIKANKNKAKSAPKVKKNSNGIVEFKEKIASGELTPEELKELNEAIKAMMPKPAPAVTSRPTRREY